MSAGIVIAEPGKMLGEGRPRYDSRRGRWQVDLTARPEHLKIETFVGGSAFVASSGAVSDQLETLLDVRHGLEYTPEVLAYFYAVTYGGSDTHPKAAKYGNGVLIYSGSAGTIADNLYISVDRTSLKVIHELDNFWPINYNSDANQYVIRMKYYILSNDSGVASYNTRGY